jgi:DMSO/TMAO reductase YedYZ molybdopterin-dependent catalytic subunit
MGAAVERLPLLGDTVYVVQHQVLWRLGAAMRNLLLAFLLVIVLSACSKAGAVSQSNWKVTVTGAVAKPLTLSYKDLAARPQATLKDLVAPHCQDASAKNTWVGPSLADLLQEAGIVDNAQRITFTAQDGYTKDLTLAEAKNAVLALQRDGKRLSIEDKGPVWLIVPDMTANFWIGRIQEIKVSAQE